MSNLPIYAHRLDLPEAYEAAGRIGRMFGAFLLDWEAVRAYAERWALVANRSTGVDAIGAQSRFCWAADEAATKFSRDQHQAERQIKSVLKPMIEVREPSNRLLAEAHNTNEDFGFPLTENEVKEITVQQIYWSMPARSPNGQRG